MVAMSGGVDSSVAAALLLRQGFEVIGATLKLWSSTGAGSTTGCCSATDAADAKAVARKLGIAHYVLDYEEIFREKVVDRTVAGYRSGITLNPCIECNREIKFRSLIERARRHSCRYVATGHYARIVREPDGPLRLLKGVDSRKDQSYVLYMLGQVELESILFPIGDRTKDEVRSEATRLGLRTAMKPESQDVCFAPDSMRVFLQGALGESLVPGNIVDTRGEILGKHDGAALYTVGQRRGLSLASGKRTYVTGIDAEKGVVTVGEFSDLEAHRVEADQMKWVKGEPPPPGVVVDVKVRSGSEIARGRIVIANDKLIIDLMEPAWAPTPGQALVCYLGNEVVGGGLITAWSQSRVS